MTAHVEGTFPGAAGGTVFWQRWEPGTTKAVVVLLHGLADHSGRYAHVAARLNDSGYAVYAADHWGHGRSEGTRGNLERFAHVTSDNDTLLSMARTEHPGLPVFLLGHSTGGLLVLDYVVGHGESGLAGLVLSGPVLDTSGASAIKRAAAGVLSKYAPNLGVLDLDANAVSRDPAEVKRYVDDPLNYHGKVRSRSGAEMILAVGRVVAGLPKMRLPVLVMHGTADRLAPPAGSKLLAERSGSKDKTLKLYDGLFHEIFNEPEKDEVLDDVVGWLDAHV
ncbi:MAG TPA: lysophospholipase [Mycobacteriales bacterium]|nr:lysophospholipase [Mycobacteriales bacterium]